MKFLHFNQNELNTKVIFFKKLTRNQYLFYLLSVQQHSIDLLDGVVGGLLGLEVHEAVSLGVTVGRILENKKNKKIEKPIKKKKDKEKSLISNFLNF